MNKNKKYKLSRAQKILISVGLIGTTLIGGGVKVFYDFEHPYKNNGYIDSYNESTYEDENVNYVDSDANKSFYDLEIEKSDEKVFIKKSKTSTKIFLSQEKFDKLKKNINDIQIEFKYGKYYDIENTLNIYNNTKVIKQKETDLLNEKGELDEIKLYNKVCKNNDAYMSMGVNSVNAFYTETDDTDKKMICDIIAEVVNDFKDKYDISEVCNTLEKLTIFNHLGMSSNALVNDELTLQYNKTMIESYNKVLQLRGADISLKDTVKSVLVHEIQHLLEYKANDLNDTNGVEAGPFRLYNNNVNVNSLWVRWILEASAEINMAEYMKINPTAYKKPISYMNSYTLSRIFDDNFNVKDFDQIAYVNNLDEMFDKLSIIDDNEKMNFLKFIYSVEIGQYKDLCNDFWANYEKQTGTTLNDNEKLSIQMQAREDAINYMTKNYYSGLCNAIEKQKINDIETVFFFMRIWELDSFNHLEYTTSNSLEHSKVFIKNQELLQNELLKALAASNNMNFDALKDMYDDYHVNIADEKLGETKDCDLNGFSIDKQNYINKIFDGYSTTNFSRNTTMINYINLLEKNKGVKY